MPKENAKFAIVDNDLQMQVDVQNCYAPLKRTGWHARMPSQLPPLEH